MPPRKPKPLQPTEVAIIDESPDGVAMRTFVSLLVILGFVLMVGFLYLIRGILLQLVIATIVALALAPLFKWFIRRGLPRVLSALLTVFITLLVMSGIVTALATPLVSQTSNLVNQFPKYVEDATKSEQVQRLDQEFHLVDKARDLSKQAPKLVGGTSTTLLNTAKSAIGVVTTFFIILTLAFFLLLEGPDSWRRLIALFRPRHAERLDRTGHQIAKAVGGYVTGNLFISLVAGTVALVTLLILKVPYPFALAVFVAIFDLIPLVGALLATIVLALVALSVSPLAAIIVLVVMTVYQQIEGNVIQPIVYSRTVQVSPLMVLVASIIGASLGGIIGVLLAIPTASTVQIIVTELLAGTASGKRMHAVAEEPKAA